MSTEGDTRREIAYVDELVERALGRRPTPGFGPSDDPAEAQRPAAPVHARRTTRQAARRVVPRHLKLFVFRVIHRITVPIVRDEVRVQLESLHHAHDALRAGVASLEVVVEDLRDSVDRLEGERRERERDDAAD